MDEPVNRRLETRRKLLALMPKGGVCAEVGVWQGGFSAEILAITEPAMLHLIDPWEYMPEFSNTGFGRSRNADRMSEMHAQVVATFRDDPRVIVHRATSQAALSALPDGGLDWIYIDGNHNEPFISADLGLAMAKVKPDGVIAGDDYLWDSGSGQPVKAAVDALVSHLGEAATFTRLGQQWMIQRIRREASTT